MRRVTRLVLKFTSEWHLFHGVHLRVRAMRHCNLGDRCVRLRRHISCSLAFSLQFFFSTVLRLRALFHSQTHFWVYFSIFLTCDGRFLDGGLQLVLGGVSVATFSQLAASEVTSQLHCWLLPCWLVRTTSWQQNKGFSQQLSHMMNHVSLPPELLTSAHILCLCCTIICQSFHTWCLY